MRRWTLAQLWSSLRWRGEKYILPVLRRLGSILIPARPMEPYDFDRARNYWQHVPRAKGANPFHTTGLAEVSDNELVLQFDREMEIAREKPERRLGFARAVESIAGLEAPFVMDYGSGIGFYGLEVLFRHPMARVTFVDINDQNLAAVERITAAKHLSGRVQFALVTDPEARDLDFHELFDLILSMGVLHHTPYAQQIVRNLTRFLKTGGIFQVMLYNFNYLKLVEKSVGRRLSYSDFGSKTDPVVTDLTNPYSEPYDDDKAQNLFQGYSLLGIDHPNPHYNIYRFRK